MDERREINKQLMGSGGYQSTNMSSVIMKTSVPLSESALKLSKIEQKILLSACVGIDLWMTMQQPCEIGIAARWSEASHAQVKPAVRIHRLKLILIPHNLSRNLSIKKTLACSGQAASRLWTMCHPIQLMYHLERFPDFDHVGCSLSDAVKRRIITI